MNQIANQNLFFVKEHVGMFKAANNFDIFNPETQQKIMECREEKLGFFTKMFRFTNYKRMTPFNITVRTTDGEKVLTVKRGTTLFLSKVDVYDEKDQLIGGFKQKISFTGSMKVVGSEKQELCTLEGKWSTWEFTFVKDYTEFARVTKKWAGIGKELFTTADNYVLKISEKVPENNPMRLLILAAVLCVDMVLKE
ncbi:MAG TPA: RNAase [Microscillaceae bacterium]|nr:RNAase [Microscillaceae bacterium]